MVNDNAKSKQKNTNEMEDDASGAPDASLTVSDAPLSSSKAPATPRKSPASPKIAYISLVQKAIENMNDRTGSSQPAIQKYILSNFPEVPEDKLKQRLLQTLKTGVANKRFVKVKASFKIHPDVKKKKVVQKKKSPSKDTEKKLTKEEQAALREAERREAKEKERLERIRKRKFPMDDLELITEDKELKVSVSLPPRPSLPLVMSDFVSFCRSDTMGNGLLDDAFHVYHFFRGDVGWGRFPKKNHVLAPFTLHQWLTCIQQILCGGAKKSRMLPPLMTHLFVVALQHLVPKELQAALTPASWSEVLMLYMDAMERYYTTEASLDSEALPGLGIDVHFLFGINDEPRDQSLLNPPTTREANFYLHGPLGKIQAKLLTHDPWMLSAEELLTLLKALADDLLATQPECSDELDFRLQESYELLKRKREADAHFRKLQNQRRKEQIEEKDQDKSAEKATRSNTKLPSITDAQFEAARRAQQKATDAYDKACRGKRIRTEPIGEDRHFHTFFHFWNDPEHVYVAQRGKPLPIQASFKVPGGTESYRTTWHTIDKRSLLEKYVESLDVRGKREAGLHEALLAAVKTVDDDIKAMNDKKALLKEKRDLQRRFENAKLKCEVGRKSGRLAAQSEQEFFDLQAEIEKLEMDIAGESQPAKPDLKVTTGLEMLRDFDQQDEQSRYRRTTRRDVQKQDSDGTDGNKHPRRKCSKLWSTGNIDGTGVVGSIVWDLLELEERVERLAVWEGDRKSWVSVLETAAHSWHISSPPQLEDDQPSSSNKESPGQESEDKQRRASGESNPLSVTTFQILTMLKSPILQLEERVFEMSGLAMAAQDAMEADDNISVGPDDDNKEEQLQKAWKRLVYRLHRLPAKSHIKIRQLVVEAIAAARKAQEPAVVGELREALLQFHPEAAGACKNAALEILEKHGGYEEDEEDEENDEVEEVSEDSAEAVPKNQSEAGLSSVLSFEGVILNSCLDGQEDAVRNDWIAALKSTKTISKLGALVAAFCYKASEKLDKLEAEQVALTDALESWTKSSTLRKKSSRVSDTEPSEVWTHVTFTDEFCLVKVEAYPWWPAKKCIVKDQDVAKALDGVERAVVSLVGESGGLRVVKKDSILPYSETFPEDQDLSSHPKEIRSQLEECKAMARRIIRGKAKKVKKGSKGRKSSGGGDSNELKEEKKLAT